MSTETSGAKPLAIFVPLSAAVELGQLQTLSEDILEIAEKKPISRLQIIYSVNSLDKDGLPTRLGYANQVAREVNGLDLPHTSASVLAIKHKGGDVTDAGGGRFVHGFYEAAKAIGNGGLVAEIDSRCHRPSDLSRVIDELVSGRQAVMSTRFFMKGAEHHFPLMRKASSFAVTVIANAFGKPGRVIPDFASGLEGYTAELLNTIFKVRPPQDWITMKTLTMLINTELRLYALWTLQERGSDLKTEVGIVPIVYAKGIPGKNFGPTESKKAISGLIELVSSRDQFLKDLRSVSLP